MNTIYSPSCVDDDEWGTSSLLYSLRKDALIFQKIRKQRVRWLVERMRVIMRPDEEEIIPRLGGRSFNTLQQMQWKAGSVLSGKNREWVNNVRSELFVMNELFII